MARLSARRTELGLAAVLGIFFMIAGGLSPRVALLGLAAAAVWAALWPSDATGRVARAGAVGQPALGNDGAWHMVVDAVPEPAIVLDGAGYVMHANRMAEDLFGARRRGGHVASMSRDPELLDGGRPGAGLRRRRRPSSCTSACPSSGGCWRRSPRSSARGPGAAGPSLLISFRDLSEQDRLAKMRADFVANASHELRTPLASLRGFVETLQGAAKDDAPGARALPQGHERAGRAHDAG